MIFLSDNFLLERDLKFDDIKPRLLGLCLLGYRSPLRVANRYYKVIGGPARA
jgi:hypothetical protein